MFSVEADDINRLIKISWSENVSADEMRECAEQLRALTADLRPGFRLLSDLTGLESMDPTGASYIAAMMDVFAAKQVGLIVRVIPDPHKDIGLSILSYFHYGSQVQIVTYQNLRVAKPLRLNGSVAALELTRSLAIGCAKLDRHRAEQTNNVAME